MKNKIFVFIILFLFPISINAFEINSKSAILYDLDSDKVLYEKNSNEITSIASLTKIMTSIVSIENISSLSDNVVITNDMIKGLIEQDAMVCGYKVGDTVTYEELLYSSLLPSCADATNALAISLTGSISNFVSLMNKKALALGLSNTHFVNTSGLDIENHYSTAYEVSVILKYALKNDTFKKIYTTKYYKIESGQILMSNLEKNLIRYNLKMDYVLGSKTGYTDDAGLCLSSIASYNGINYLLITIGADPTLDLPYNIIDSNTIYNYYFENYTNREIANKEISLNNKYSKDKIIINLPSHLEKLTLDEYSRLEYLYDIEDEVSIFTRKEKLGEYKVLLDGETLYSTIIYKPSNIPFSLIVFLYKNIYIELIIIMLGILFWRLIWKLGKLK